MKKFFSIFYCIWTILCVNVNKAIAQEANSSTWKGTVPQGKFLADSIKLGLPVKYVLSLKHPADMEVIFPDSAYNFFPFEFLEKQYFPTRTDHTGSLDSVIYTLTSFETDILQRLRLPVFIIMNQDCTAVYSAYDTVQLQHLITAKVDSLKPKININYRQVELYFNYTNFLLIVFGISLLTGIVYIFFGKRIRREYRLYRMGREHANFRNAFGKLTRSISAEQGVHTVENAVILWKKYMELLEEKPFSTYTSKEILEIIPNQQLAEALQQTDRIIYGQMNNQASTRYTQVLAHIAKRSYIEKRTFLEKQKV